MPESRGWFRSGRGGDVERRAREHGWALERRVELLERDRKDLRRILASLGEGVLAVDSTGVVLHANPAAIELLGLDATALVGNHLYVAVPHQRLCDALEDVMRGVETRDTRITRELSIERPDGARLLVAQVTPLRGTPRDAAGDVGAEGAIAVVRDVTELRRLEGARQDFFGNVSHELKTPITAIRGALETIVDDPEMPVDVRNRFLDGAVRHSARLNTLVNDLLALARLESDPGALQRAPFDVIALLGEVRDAAETTARAREVEVELVVEGASEADLPAGAAYTIVADEESLRQAVSNLVGNAIAYSEAGGRVQLRVSRTHHVVELEVSDTGSGIPAESLERIFERFYRVDAARSRALGGTGIGLSIVKHVAQAHGGSVEVRSELGVGSTFVLRLPVSASGVVGTSRR